MSSLSSMTALSPAHGRPAPALALVQVRAAIVAVTARPVEPGAASSAATTADAVVTAAREKIEAAVRDAVLKGLMRSSAGAAAAADASAGSRPAPPPERDVLVEEIIARVKIRMSQLPVLPEPATPARDAFAEAVIAMRSGLRWSADGVLAGGA